MKLSVTRHPWGPPSALQCGWVVQSLAAKFTEQFCSRSCRWNLVLLMTGERVQGFLLFSASLILKTARLLGNSGREWWMLWVGFWQVGSWSWCSIPIKTLHCSSLDLPLWWPLTWVRDLFLIYWLSRSRQYSQEKHGWFLLLIIWQEEDCLLP